MKRDRGLRRPGTLQEVLRLSVCLCSSEWFNPMTVGAGPASLSHWYVIMKHESKFLDFPCNEWENWASHLHGPKQSRNHGF